jgi:hypothetical protein
VVHLSGLKRQGKIAAWYDGAIDRHNQGSALVIPVILRPCDLEGSPFMKLQALPKNLKLVTQWDDQDEAFLNVVQGIRRAVESLAQRKL